MLKPSLFSVALLAGSLGALAQQPPSVGGQIRQIPPPPTIQPVAPGIRIEQGPAPASQASGQVRITVNQLRITGQTLYPEAQLLAVTGFAGAGELTLSDLNVMAARISEHYRRNGYFVAQAYLPAQDIKDGVVNIAVVEGRYGNVTLRNQSRLSDAMAHDLLAGLGRGDIIERDALDSRLLLLSDVPGVAVSSTLAPGAAPGSSDLIVELTPGQLVSGSVEADNAGNRYTGAARVGATVNLNNLAGHGDVASLRVLYSGHGLAYGRASYQMMFGRLTAGVAYTALNYQLGEEFAALQAHGTARIASLYVSYPLIRSRNNNMFVGLDYDHKTMQDFTDSTSSVVDKRAQVLTARLHGNGRDHFLGGGVANYSIALSSGDLDIRTPAQLAADAAGARTQGHFWKLALQSSRLQYLTDSLSFYISGNVQFASKNLDISEKMSLGGPYGVRAYPVGEAYGDEASVITLELRQMLPKFSETMPGRVQLVGFIDTGAVIINKEPFGAGPNHRRLSGAGIGLTWEEPNNFSVKTYYAHKLGHEVATSAPDKKGRFWIQLVKYF